MTDNIYYDQSITQVGFFKKNSIERPAADDDANDVDDDDYHHLSQWAIYYFV